MVKHNNIVPNAHFHKDWARYVRTWFDQPAKKVKRRAKRAEKAARKAPRPVNLLRPAVHCQTVRYNAKLRSGRGFTFDELKAAGISKKAALGIGIAVDHRRKNRSEEAFRANVQRLKTYKSKLIIFPRRNSSVKKGDASVEERKAATQTAVEAAVPLPTAQKRVRARAITKDERERKVVSILRKARMDAKLWGRREKRAKDKETKKAAPKEDKEEKGGDDD